MKPQSENHSTNMGGPPSGETQNEALQQSLFFNLNKIMLRLNPIYRIMQGEHFYLDRYRLQLFAARISRAPLLYSIKSELVSFNKKILLERRFRRLIKHHSDNRFATSKMCAALVLLLDKIKVAQSMRELEQRVVEAGSFTETFFHNFGMSLRDLCRLFAVRHGNAAMSRSTTHERISSLWIETYDDMSMRLAQEPEKYAPLRQPYPESHEEADMLNSIQLSTR